MIAMNHVLGMTRGTGGQPKWGTVESYNPAEHTARVRVQPEGYLTGDLPCPSIGSGTTSFRYAPVAGQMTLLLPESGDMDSLVIVTFAHNDDAPPADTATDIGGAPVPLQPGEFSLSGPDGLQMRWAAGGVLYIKANTVKVEASDTITVQAPNTAWTGDITLDGKLSATQNITSDAQVKDFHGTVDSLRQKHNTHTHKVLGIGGPTAPTDNKD